MGLPIITSRERHIIRWWWVILFFFLCGILYEQSVKKRDRDFAKLSEQLKQLYTDKDKVMKTQQDLLLRMNSQSDPAWQELVLMQKLGVAPEDQTKVFFTQSQ